MADVRDLGPDLQAVRVAADMGQRPTKKADVTNWRAQLAGDAHALAKLPAWFDGNLARVLFVEDACYLESSGFVEGMSPHEVLAVAREIAELMTGAALQIHGERITISPANVREIDEQGRGHVYVMIEAAVEMSATLGLTVLRADGATEAQERPSEVRADALLEVSYREEAVADVLVFLGRQHDWHNLWKLWELIRSDVVEQGWATKADIARFGASANRSDLSGREARHADSTGAKPSFEPMTILIGDAFVSRLVKRWLEWRVKEFLDHG
jgi:hypothetical protein